MNGHSQDTLLGPIKAIIAEELPEYYTAEIDLAFDNLCEGQEDNFKLVIKISWNEKADNFHKAGEIGSVDWTHRIHRRIHQLYGDGLLTSIRLPACQMKA